MDQKTKELVEAAEARANAARLGPWWVSGEFVRAAHPNQRFPGVLDIADGMLGEDAEFIAHARQDVPALCAIVREQVAENERLQARISELENAEEERRLDRQANDLG